MLLKFLQANGGLKGFSHETMVKEWLDTTLSLNGADEIELGYNKYTTVIWFPTSP